MSTVTTLAGKAFTIQQVSGPGYINVQLSTARGGGTCRARTGDFIITFEDDSVAVLTSTQFYSMLGSFVISL